MSNNSADNKRIAKNTLMLYLRMMIQMIIGLYTTRIVLQALGVDDYGIYNVVGSMTALLSFINGAMTNATVRFATFELGRDNKKRLNLIFCISMHIHIVIAIITVLVLETVGVWFLYNKMVIVPERLQAAFWVLQFSIFTCLMGIISVPYTACIIAHEKMGAFAFISMANIFLTLLLALSLPYIPFDRLIFYALVLFLIHMFIRWIYQLYCVRHFEESKYRLIWDKPLAMEMVKFAGWTMNGNIAYLGYTQGMNVLINVFFGTVVNAARGIAFTVQSKIMSFCDNFQTAVRPQIIKSFSTGDYERMHSLIISSSKFSFYLLLALSVPVYIELDTILSLWLGFVPEHTANFARITLFIAGVDVLRNPMNAAIHATGDIKKFQLWEATTLLSIVPLAYLTLKLGYGAESAFIVQLIIFLIVQIERVFLICPKIYMSKSYYAKNLIWPLFKVVLLITIPLWTLLCSFPINEASYEHLFFYLPSSFLIVVIVIYIFGLNESEKNVLIAQVKKIISKIK